MLLNVRFKFVNLPGQEFDLLILGSDRSFQLGDAGIRSSL